MATRSPWLCPLFALWACGGESTDDTTLEPAPAGDIELHCPADVAPELAEVGPIRGSLTLGPCGHLAYHDDSEQGWLIEPDGTRNALDHDPYQVRFAPTGDHLAWVPNQGRLRLRELLSGGEREISGSADSSPRFGFVPSFTDASRSIWLWTCEAGVLSRHDLEGDASIAESVRCSSVVASGGSPRVAYASEDGRVWLADLDAAAVVSGSADFDYSDSGPRGDGLWVDHDGEFVIHRAVVWEGPSDGDAEFPVPMWTRVFDRHGEILIEDIDAHIGAMQAARRNAPLYLVRLGGVIQRIEGGVIADVVDSVSRMAMAARGELFVVDQADALVLAEADPELALVEIGSWPTLVELATSPDAGALAFEHHSDICIVEEGECSRILLALRRWTRVDGVSATEVLSASPWSLAATTSEGHVLAVGTPVQSQGGATWTGEVPEPRVLWMDGEGDIVAELPAPNGEVALRQAFALSEEALLFEYQSQAGKGELLVARAGVAGFESIAPTVDVALLQARIDGRAQRVAFVAEGGVASLWFGALPD